MSRARGQSEVTLIPVRFSDDIQPADDLTEKLEATLKRQHTKLYNGDIVVIKHKIISKAEGRTVRLSGVKPAQVSKNWARKSSTDPRVVQLALNESRKILRKKIVAGRGVLITETSHGFICANSGVDVSNVDGGEHAVLLPRNPDRSAVRLRAAIKKRLGVTVAVVISDSFGRPWREGLTEVAIGVAGMRPLRDDRSETDPHGYKLRASVEAIADEAACAAGLVCGKLNRTPVCILRGVSYEQCRGTARELLRPRNRDLFR